MPFPFFKHKLVSFTLFTAFLFILAIATNYFVKKNNENPEKKYQQSQKAFLKIENQGLYYLGSAIGTYSASQSFSSLQSFIDLYDREGILLLTYSKDSLVFWSDNAVPVPLKYDPLLFESGFLELDNGWFRSLASRSGDHYFVCLVLIKSNYPYKNDYLINTFPESLGLSPDVSISDEPGDYNITSSAGDFLFSLEFPEDLPLPESAVLWLLLLYVAAFISLITLVFRIYEKLPFFNRRKYFLAIAFLVDVFILWFILFYFSIPSALYESQLFSPFFFASSTFMPSFGDLILTIVFLLTAIYLLYSRPGFIPSSSKTGFIPSPSKTGFIPSSSKTGKTSVFLLFAAIILLYYLLVFFIKNLVLNSSFTLDINHIYDFTIYSFLAYLLLAAALFIFFLITSRFCKAAIDMAGPKSYLLTMSLALILLFFPVYQYIEPDPVFYLLIVAYLGIYLFLYKNNFQFSAYSIIILLIYFAFFSNYSLNKYLNIKERDHRELLASELASERDPMMEFEFELISSRLVNDDYIKSLLLRPGNEALPEQDIIAYLEEAYFQKLKKKYDLLITLCKKDEVLHIQPEGYLIDCETYFNDLIENLGQPTYSKNFYYLADNSENDNYIAALSLFYEDTTDAVQLDIYIELFSRIIPEEGLGYLELLSDKENSLIADLSAYSYARYRNGRLTYKYGPYHYSILPQSQDTAELVTSNYDMNGYNHFILKISEGNYLVLSKNNSPVIDIIAPFSYLFVFFGFFVLCFLLIFIFPFKEDRFNFSFREQFQITIISIILVSFIAVGLITRAYIIDLNNQKNIGIISEKTHSVLIELEHKISDVQEWSPELESYLNELLYKFSMVFFSDINLFDLDGHLLATSRPEIYNEGLISIMMNSKSFYALSHEHQLQFIHTEAIGLHYYLSSYIPFMNNQDKVIAYLNLPYFAKQSELKKEFAAFLMAYINIFVLITVLAILLTIIVSRYITKPLQMLKGKLVGVKLDGFNEKLEWKRNDEIGSLVAEYNRMIDELKTSAELLARSERESAWREMAKQVAHEIKNPLTPMKLSVQHLKVSWKDEVPDFSERLDRICNTLSEQIDSLSTIATEFSDFALMPQPSIEKINLADVIESSVALFKDIQNIHIVLEFDTDDVYEIKADRQHMVRVFNNLIKNAVQAIGRETEGNIRISIKQSENQYITEVTDDGPGIPEDQANKIFSPSFTTKSSGMGLGLAIVQSIIMEAGGEISFTSEPGNGASFLIVLPLIQDHKAEGQ